MLPQQVLDEMDRQTQFWWGRRYNFTDVVNDYGDVVDVIAAPNTLAGAIGGVSSAANDAYLKTQGQEDGVESYGRMIDFVVGFYLAKGE
jgi:hypothetical protein